MRHGGGDFADPILAEMGAHPLRDDVLLGRQGNTNTRFQVRNTRRQRIEFFAVEIDEQVHGLAHCRPP